jgi:ankyrin repeat protein
MKDRLGAGFESLRKQAKRWLASLRAGDREALARLERVLPRHSAQPGLREVQQALAREHGFASWAQLKEHHEILALTPESLLDELLQSACIFSGGPLDFPQKWNRAERIRVLHPQLATASIHAAVVCGELDHVARLLAQDPSLATRPGGPQRWEPLLLLCYARMPNERFATNSVAIAELLLDGGAKADTSFVLPEGDLRFFALTGVMGHGEMGAPEHPRADELARLLLTRGANPNDSQGLYNTHLGGDDPKWLSLLLQHGLGPDDLMNWCTKPEDLAKAEPILSYLVAQAAANGHVRRLTMLLEHGADPNAKSVYDGKSCWQAATIVGRTDLAELLAKHGARTEPLQGIDAFVSACNLRDRERATALFDPSYLERSDPLIEAASRGRRDAVALMLELGFDPNKPGRHGHLPLHNACGNRAMVELLLAHGADPRLRVYGGTPAEWARHQGNVGMARLFAERTRDLLDAVLAGHVILAEGLLREDPSCVHARAPDGATALHLLPEDPEIARPLVELLLAHGIDTTARDDDGKTAAERLEANGLDELADLI